MALNRIYITGVGGLVGSAVAELAISRGIQVVGSESDARGRWFGPGGSVGWRVLELESAGVIVDRHDFRTHLDLVKGVDAVIHCAAQPSHDLSREQPLEDASLSFMGTVSLLEAVRAGAPDASFVFLSTNKVYGDRINRHLFRETPLRFEADEVSTGLSPWYGVAEDFPIDDSLHTPFGASKAAADLMVQEYRRCYGLKTVSLRCGCLTGPTGSAVELHGFLGYLVKAAMTGKPYTIYGYGGKQVRDNLCASDLAEAILLYAEDPKGGVYNMGGGRPNSISILEALAFLDGRECNIGEVSKGPERMGDHMWWISDIRKFQHDYPEWYPRTSVRTVMEQMLEAERKRQSCLKKI